MQTPTAAITQYFTKSLQSTQEGQREVMSLEEYFRDLPDHATCDWLAISMATGIRMDARGKGRVRRALKRLQRPYETIPKTGIRLSGPDNALSIVAGKTSRVGGAIKSLARAVEQCTVRHLSDMREADRQALTQARCRLGSLAAACQSTEYPLVVVPVKRTKEGRK